MTEPAATTDTHSIGAVTLRKALGVAAALAVAAGGLLHLRTWNSDYREIPDGVVPGLWVVKVGFPLNGAASVALAGLLVAVTFGVLPATRRFVYAAALALQLGSVVALVASRGPGVFAWSEKGYEGDARLILFVEMIAIVLLSFAWCCDAKASKSTK